MFLISVRVTKRKILFFVLLIAMLFLFLFDLSGGFEKSIVASTDYSNEDQRIAYVESFGWQISDVISETLEITIPTEFNDTYEQYNQLQIKQGFDLRQYKGRVASRYSYDLLNHPSGDSTVKANLIVIGGRIVGADVCSLLLNGFIEPLKK